MSGFPYKVNTQHIEIECFFMQYLNIIPSVFYKFIRYVLEFEG